MNIIMILQDITQSRYNLIQIEFHFHHHPYSHHIEYLGVIPVIINLADPDYASKNLRLKNPQSSNFNFKWTNCDAVTGKSISLSSTYLVFRPPEKCLLALEHSLLRSS